jgi:arabinose-5-phosphate isomerase
MDAKEIAIKCLKDEMQAISDLIPLLTDDFAKAVEMICLCNGKVVVTGVGKSGHIAKKIASTLASTGTPSFFLHPLDAYHGDLGMIAKNDIVMAISNSGKTEELIRIIPHITNRDIPIIAMTGNHESALVKSAVCHLNISVKKESCPLNLAPTSSTTAMLALGDALACALIYARNFTANDYKVFHPGGDLGARLL